MSSEPRHTGDRATKAPDVTARAGSEDGCATTASSKSTRHPRLAAIVALAAVGAAAYWTIGCADERDTSFQVGFVWRGAELHGQGGSLDEAIIAACRTYCRQRDPLFAACVRECQQAAAASEAAPPESE